MTKQEYLDLIVRTSRAGLFPAVREDIYGDEQCRYRTPDGRRCFAGLLIPDEKYDQTLEGKTVDTPQVAKVIEVPDGMTLDELYAIQNTHDDVVFCSKPWDHGAVIARLLALPCFHGMTPSPV